MQTPHYRSNLHVSEEIYSLNSLLVCTCLTGQLVMHKFSRLQNDDSSFEQDHMKFKCCIRACTIWMLCSKGTERYEKKW